MPRSRLDAELVRRGLAETRERAHALILDGAVSIDGTPATRPAQPIELHADLQVARPDQQYVSRGAIKLEAALDHWHIDPSNKTVLDIGASTGGFTDLLLQRGACRVFAVDVGHGQLHLRLRNDPRVVVMERTNARYLTSLPEPADLASLDVSFISLRLVLPSAFALTREAIVALIKPQFEAGREHVRKGVVRDSAVHSRVLHELAAWSKEQPWQLTDVLPSPIRGPKGNIEFLSRWLPDAAIVTADGIQRVVQEAAIISRG